MIKDIYHIAKIVCLLDRGLEFEESAKNHPTIAKQLKEAAVLVYNEASEHVALVKEHEWRIADDPVGHYQYACMHYPHYTFRKMVSELEVAIEEIKDD